MSGTNYVSAIDVHICRSVVPGRAGGHVQGRSVAYENQALQYFTCFIIHQNVIVLAFFNSKLVKRMNCSAKKTVEC